MASAPHPSLFASTYHASLAFNHPFKARTINQRQSLQLHLLCPCVATCAHFTAFFRFGSHDLDSHNASIYGSQDRDDFDRDDVEQYFNYMSMLATEASYDKMEALLNKGIHLVNILLLLAATEGDRLKIVELIRSSADYTVYDVEGRTTLDSAKDEEIWQLILHCA